MLMTLPHNSQTWLARPCIVWFNPTHACARTYMYTHTQPSSLSPAQDNVLDLSKYAQVKSLSLFTYLAHPQGVGTLSQHTCAQALPPRFVCCTQSSWTREPEACQPHFLQIVPSAWKCAAARPTGYGDCQQRVPQGSSARWHQGRSTLRASQSRPTPRQPSDSSKLPPRHWDQLSFLKQSTSPRAFLRMGRGENPEPRGRTLLLHWPGQLGDRRLGH